MSTPTPEEMTLDAIRSVPLFASLDDEATRELRSLLRTREVASGTPLFRAGDDGDAMYLIESGRVRISMITACSTQRRTAASTLSFVCIKANPHRSCLAAVLKVSYRDER